MCASMSVCKCMQLHGVHFTYASTHIHICCTPKCMNGLYSYVFIDVCIHMTMHCELHIHMSVYMLSCTYSKRSPVASTYTHQKKKIL